jgi:hypothetical protein
MQPSAPFRDREFNGTTLLEEWAEVRAGRESPLAVALAAKVAWGLAGLPVADARTRLGQWADAARGETPALAALVCRWAGRLRAPADTGLLAAHLERLSLLGEALGTEGRRP